MSEFYAKPEQATVSEGLAQSPHEAARVGFEPTTPGRHVSTLPMSHYAPQHTNQFIDPRRDQDPVYLGSPMYHRQIKMTTDRTIYIEQSKELA